MQQNSSLTRQVDSQKRSVYMRGVSKEGSLCNYMRIGGNRQYDMHKQAKSKCRLLFILQHEGNLKKNMNINCF